MDVEKCLLFWECFNSASGPADEPFVFSLLFFLFILTWQTLLLTEWSTSSAQVQVQMYVPV